MLILALAASITVVATSSSAKADTSDFRGMNWARLGDNFTTGRLVLQGLNINDSYNTVYAKSTALYDDMESTMGVNTVRLPINTHTVADAWWNNYRATIDAATDRGFKVILAYWEDGAASGGRITNLSAWNTMWSDVTSAYSSNGLVYFEPMNEPHGYSSSAWRNVAADWLDYHYSAPASRVLIGGTGYSQDLRDICNDSRFDSTMLSLHHYLFMYNSTRDYWGWRNHFEERQGNAACYSRAVVTEFGAPMDNGLNYDTSSYTDNFVAYIRGITGSMHERGIGSVYWPATGGKETNNSGYDWYSMYALSGSGSNLNLGVRNTSGAKRVMFGWGDTNPVVGGGGGSGTTYVKLQNRATGQFLDGMGRTTNGDDAGQWSSSGSANQQWQIVSSGSYVTLQNRATGQFLDGMGRTSNGAALGQWAPSGSSNQQWTQTTTGGYVQFQNRASNLYIDGMARTGNGDAVGQWSGSGSANQQWAIVNP